MEDVILVTVDCWRYDATACMPRLRSLIGEKSWHTGTVITQSSTTSNTFPAIFASEYFPRTWHKRGGLRPDVETLMSVLADEGYSLGGFAASNPWVENWRNEFDAFWNGGIEQENERFERVRKGLRFARLESTSPAEEALSKANDWWERTDSPRFLWVHMMEPHGPYFPGFGRAMSTGPVRTVASYLGAALYEDNEYPPWLTNHSRRLYDKCVQRLDTKLTPWLKTMADEATILLTADHGQEFDHGHVGHRRLYDEVLRVPVVSNRDIPGLASGLTRQLDITPTLLSYLDIQSDHDWEGEPAEHTMQPQLLLSSPNSVHDCIWAGIRTPETKVILTYDFEWELEQTEVYDITSDPEELNDVSAHAKSSDLVERIQAFVEDPAIREPMNDWHPEVGLLEDHSVEDRLEHLGYLN